MFRPSMCKWGLKILLRILFCKFQSCIYIAREFKFSTLTISLRFDNVKHDVVCTIYSFVHDIVCAIHSMWSIHDFFFPITPINLKMDAKTNFGRFFNVFPKSIWYILCNHHNMWKLPLSQPCRFSLVIMYEKWWKLVDLAINLTQLSHKWNSQNNVLNIFFKVCIYIARGAWCFHYNFISKIRGFGAVHCKALKTFVLGPTLSLIRKCTSKPWQQLGLHRLETRLAQLH